MNKEHNHENETGHLCHKCGQLFPSCLITRTDLPGAEGTGCYKCYPKHE